MAKLLKFGATYLLCVLSGWLFARLGLPLPWMIGPLLATAALALSGVLREAMPVRTRPFGQAVVASTVGLSFTAEALRVVIELMPLLIGMSAMTAGLALAMSLIQARLSGAKLSRMVLATFPVAPVEAAIIAENSGIAAAPVVMAQTLRIAAVVVAVPLLLYAIDGRPETVSALSPNGDWDAPGLALMVLAVLAGGAVFHRFGWANPFFLGPLAAVGIATAFGADLSPYPPVILGAAQITLGAWLGSTFQAHLFEGARRELIASTFGTVLLLALVCAGAVLIARLSGLSWETVILATAPGGVTEMALTAQYLDQDVSLVTAAHVVRIFLLMPLARPLVRLARRFDQGP
ncbi:AbrB family transcriptional regulator [Paracoccus sediminicola]|uniref:AbrB family transcriptional regulator n=1 Tax=Paracoccus sediminicola TaxID=3017783 RepID=UPI0022F03A69|nr:AbrB family transcriptional regulator [Paracoccus sediminicola]WBU57487.1 AbrB family transcriptional regulator [Paracoccus sediminicola]